MPARAAEPRGLKLPAMSNAALPTFRRSLMQASIALLGATALGIAACGGGGGGDGDGQFGNESPLDVSQPASDLGSTTILNAALDSPWGLAFLPNGSMLVSEKPGTVALVDLAGNLVRRLTGVPSVDATGQGGLLDIAFNANYVYFTYTENVGGQRGTAVARANLNDVNNPTSLQNLQVVWRQTPKNGNEIHYGARIAFAADGTMFVAVGERGVEGNDGNARADGVQSPANSLGKVLRLNLDGSVPSDNPSFGAGAVPGLYSIGHRNPQGAAVRPGSSELWITEHGPQAGDELNRVSAGANYGWPVRSYGCDYAAPAGSTCRIGGGTHAPDFTEPRVTWSPATAPSGLIFYNGVTFPEWSGSLLAGALNGTTLWRIALDANGRATSRQEISAVKNLGVRVRDVRQGPDGNVYLLTNGGGNAAANRIVRLAP
jgi:glucose/arabinose dehydrogenase